MNNFCPQCHRPLRPNAKFCSACGATIGIAPVQSLQPGQTLDGTYHIQRSLAKGGMGAIYLVEDLKAFGRQRVIKEMLDYFDVTDPQQVASAQRRFEDEARTLAQLHHPGIPDILTYFSTGSHHYIVMEYVEGQSLEAILSQKLPKEEILKYGAQVCQILEYLGSLTPPVIHQDIKPANIVIEKTTNSARLVDFGTAKARLTPQSGGKVGLKKSSIYGTAGYAPPEQYNGQSEVRSDVYALAATLYHLLTGDDPGDHPFNFPQLPTLPTNIREPLANALLRDVGRRGVASELRQGLESALNSPGSPQTGSTRPKSTIPPRANEFYAVVAQQITDSLRPDLINYLVQKRGYKPNDAEVLSYKSVISFAKMMDLGNAQRIRDELKQIKIAATLIKTNQSIGWRVNISADEKKALQSGGEYIVRDKRYPQDNQCNCYHCGHSWSTKAASVDTLLNNCTQCGNPWYQFRLFQCAQCAHQFAHADIRTSPLSLFPHCPVCKSEEWHIVHRPRLQASNPQKVTARAVKGQAVVAQVSLSTLPPGIRLTGRALASVPWLTVTPSTFQSAGQIQLVMDSSQLQPRISHKCYVDLITNLGINQIPVEFYVEASAQLGTSAQQIDFGVVAPTQQIEQTLRIVNQGEQKLQGKLTSIPIWLHADVVNFQNETVIRLVAIGPAFKQAGRYQENLTIASNGGNLSIPVTATVLPLSAQVNPLNLNMGSLPRGKRINRTLTIANQGIGLLEGTIESDAKWLSVSPQVFQSNRIEVKATADAAGLPRNATYSAVMTIDTNGGLLTVPITLQVPEHNRIAQVLFFLLFLTLFGMGYLAITFAQSNQIAARSSPTASVIQPAPPIAATLTATPSLAVTELTSTPTTLAELTAPVLDSPSISVPGGLASIQPTAGATTSPPLPTPEPTNSPTPVPTATSVPIQNPPAIASVPICPAPQAVLTAPLTDQVLRGRVQIRGRAVHEQFNFYKLEMAAGADTQAGTAIFAYLAGGQSPVENGVLAEWVTTTVANGTYTLRLTVVAEDGNYPPPCQVTVQVRN